MRWSNLFLPLALLSTILAAPRPSHAQTPVSVDPAWSPGGWVFLAETAVNGKRDHDTLVVRAPDTSFSHLMLVTAGSDLELKGIAITFGNGEVFRPEVSHWFKEGARTRAIDFPGNGRNIKEIDLRYGNTPGTGQARVQVWAQATPQAAPAFDAGGHTLLGKRVVNGRYDHDVLKVGGKKGPFHRVVLAVEGSDLDMFDVVITFHNGERYSPPTRFHFAEGSRTVPIDLPGDARRIKSITFKYGNLPGGGRATLSVYGR